MQVEQIKSDLFTSNVYLLRSSIDEDFYLIDCGCFKPVYETIKSSYGKLKGIFITHFHYDHIYSLGEWLDKYPDLIVYGSIETLNGLSNSKINLSFYHENPVEVKVNNFQVISDGDTIEIIDGLIIEAIETEGHCSGSLTYRVENYFFTGDALIPNIPTVTKLKTGSKEKSKNSIRRIFNCAKTIDIVCPGHLEMISVQDVNWQLYL